MSLIPDDLDLGDHVCVTVTGVVTDIEPKAQALAIDKDWIYPAARIERGSKVTVEKIEKPFTSPARGALFVSSGGVRSEVYVYASLGEDGFVLVRSAAGRLTGSRAIKDDIAGTWDGCDLAWRNGITVIAEATP